MLPSAMARPFVVKPEVRTAEHAGHIGLQHKVDGAGQAKGFGRWGGQAGGRVMGDAQVIRCDSHLIGMGVAPGPQVAYGKEQVPVFRCQRGKTPGRLLGHQLGEQTLLCRREADLDGVARDAVDGFCLRHAAKPTGTSWEWNCAVSSWAKPA